MAVQFDVGELQFRFVAEKPFRRLIFIGISRALVGVSVLNNPVIWCRICRPGIARPPLNNSMVLAFRVRKEFIFA